MKLLVYVAFRSNVTEGCCQGLIGGTYCHKSVIGQILTTKQSGTFNFLDDDNRKFWATNIFQINQNGIPASEFVFTLFYPPLPENNMSLKYILKYVFWGSKYDSRGCKRPPCSTHPGPWHSTTDVTHTQS